MDDFLDRIRTILRYDLDPDFLEAVATAIAWRYSTLFDELAECSGLTDSCREEEFNKRRGDAVRDALADTAKRFGVPFDLRRLSVNGQHKILISVGRVILVQEAIAAREDHPNPADYKKELADTHGWVRQLEFDFGDGRYIQRDWSGHVLVVLLHGPASFIWSRGGKELGNLMLAVPDAAYQNWVLRLDLRELAMFGRRGDIDLVHEEADSEGRHQVDQVVVMPKRRNRARDVG